MTDIVYAGDAGVFKTCTKCGEAKQLIAFGTKSHCRSCVKVYNDEYRALTRPKVDARKKPSFPPFACESCGKETQRTSSRQRYCKECSSVAKMEYDRARPSKDFISRLVICQWCKGEFVRASSGQKYCCEKCTKSALKDRQKLAARKRRLDPVEIAKISVGRKGRVRNNETRRAYEKKRTAEDAKYAINRRMKAMVNNALSGKKNGRSWVDVVGYTPDALMRHLERQFMPGMTWANRSKWHIDHILPQAHFVFDSDEDPEFKSCWALTNLRPLWSEINQSKGCRRTLLI